MSDGNYTITKEDGSQQFVDHNKAWENVTGALNKEENAMERKTVMGDFLQGIRGEVNSQHLTKETFSAYSEKYMDVYTKDERKKQISKKGTELWQKQRNAEFIEKQELARQTKMQSRATAAMKKAGIRENYTSPDVVALSAFMGTKTGENADLLRYYRGNEKRRVILACMKKFMKLDLKKLDIKSDKKVAENAEELERLSELFSGIQYLITASPEIYAALPEKTRLSFEQYYGKANTVVTYYRLKKQVMLDSFYRTHENREIGKDQKGFMSADQRNLTEMIWQASGGLAIFLNKSNEYILDGTLKGLRDCLRKEGVSKNRLALQSKLRKRREEIEKRGLADRMDEFFLKERRIDVKGKLGITGHARNLKELKLSGDPVKDLDFLPYILDQREVIVKAGKIREESSSSYLTEQSDFQISVADKALAMSGTLKRIEEDLLTIGRLTKGGAIDAAVSEDQIAACKARYAGDLAEYRQKMEELRAARIADYKIEAEESPENAEYKAPENEKSDPLTEAKVLVAKLTLAGFSDGEIYKNRDNICSLSKACKGTEVSEVLDVLAKRAVVVWEKKRLLNVKAALAADKDNAALKDEKKRLTDREKLRRKHKDEDGNIVEGSDETMESILKLRAEAEKKLFDFRDLKAQAAHYTDQYDWALNARNEGRGFLLWLASGLFKGFYRYFGTDRELVHGEEKYDEAVERLQRLPQEIREHQDGTPLTLQRGDEDVPPVDMVDLYEDKMKDELKLRIAGVREKLTGREDQYPEEIRTAVEAMEHYVKVKYTVTSDTVEMEMAFLDKFRKDLDRAFVKLRNVSFDDSVIKGLLEISDEISSMGRGKLKASDNPERMTDAEFEAANEQVAIHTMFSKDDLKESNVKDIPLFLHKPNINDVKQGYVGDCYFMSAITAFIRSNPEGIMEMFHDIGDGNVMVRLYMAFDENNRRVDTLEEMDKPSVTMKPVYIKVRKDYDMSATAHDCMWAQLLEKAYTSTGTQHKVSKVDAATGKLSNLACEIAGGSPRKAMMHLTGRKDCWENSKPEREEYELDDNEIDARRKRMLLKGVPLWMQNMIWDDVKDHQFAEGEDQDGFIANTLETVRNKVTEMNAIRREQFKDIKEAVLKDVPGVKEADLETIWKRIDELYNLDPEKMAEQVMKNILTESPGLDDGTDMQDPAAAIARLYDNFNGGMTLEEILADLERKDTYYTAPAKLKGEDDKLYKNRLTALELYANNRNKAMMEMNPGNRYSREEMIFLHDIRAAKKRKEGMTFGITGHAMDILDVKLSKGRWFVMVRDTNNVRNFTYEKDEEGELKSMEGKTSFAVKKEIRKLDGTLLKGATGSSWWELKDVFGKMQCYGNAPKLRE
ncbi:MAG: hypothetical protein IJP84_05325 [Lachnospiraceae bacterium]|nr:hypothetical protein [Lachnospiraceae bacterium]